MNSTAVSAVHHGAQEAPFPIPSDSSFSKTEQIGEPASKVERDTKTSNRLVQEDWTDFRNLESLGRRAGVARDRIPAVVLKELFDNAADAGRNVGFGKHGTNGLFVLDDGGGIPGTDEEIANLFSIRRPRTSSKIVRMPTRGALGNGLRVVAGAVLASGGTLRVITRGRELPLTIADDGNTTVAPRDTESWRAKSGFTSIIVEFGDGIDFDFDDASDWAKEAQLMGDVGGTSYKGKPSAFWWDSDSFFEFVQAAGAMPVRQLVEKLDGCTGGKAGLVAASFLNRTCESLGRDDADALLQRARADSRPVKPARLGRVGKSETLGAGYAHGTGERKIKASRGKCAAIIPFVVEAWASVAKEPGITVFANRTPITSEASVGRSGDDKASYYFVVGDTCGTFKVGRKNYKIRLNVTTPYMPLMNDGKAPDLWPIWSTIKPVLEKAVRAANKLGATSSATSQKDTIRDAVDKAIGEVSQSGKYRYSLRQLFYAIRPALIDSTGKEPSYKTFSQHITAIESERGGDLPGIYRDNRGILYHPHTGETIPLGTQSIEEYRRPEWSFNKVLYCEKEGFFPSLKAAKWPELHDCALVTGKGYASRAARDLLDLLGESGEPIRMFCVHDADGPGTMIYQSLLQATEARCARKVEVINLGLDPAEAIEMGMAVEAVKRDKERKIPVADYVDSAWKKWLQTQRVELNAMTPAQLMAWLDRKIAPYDSGKVIPPGEVQRMLLDQQVKGELSARLHEQAAIAYGVDARLADGLVALQPFVGEAAKLLPDTIAESLTENPAESWRAAVEDAAKGLVEQHAGYAQ